MTHHPKILLAVTGATGAIYARRVLHALLQREELVGLTLSAYGQQIVDSELGQADDPVSAVLGYDEQRVIFYPRDRYDGPFATGSESWQAMLIVPCSMGTVGRIASGISTDLITRAADVALKEKRKLILVPRETPLNLIHLRNLTTLAEAGAIVVPPAPGFYQHPQTMDDLINFVVERIVAQV
ncbi:MAG TPA: UbiX family flavin prenyltransferase [Armatimonadota bacterium]|nr:UbiX family flavin prenyltransferase [Armatimonadota bacterium]